MAPGALGKLLYHARKSITAAAEKYVAGLYVIPYFFVIAPAIVIGLNVIFRH